MVVGLTRVAMKLQVLLLFGAGLALLSVLVLWTRGSSRQRSAPGAAIAPGPKPQTLPPGAILFSLPTLCDALPPLDSPVAAIPSGALALHEDNWRQVEFVSNADRDAVDRELDEVRRFKTANASGPGWKNVYVRKARADALLPRRIPLSRLLDLVHVSTPNRLFISTSETFAEVRDGFAVPLEAGTVLYGYSTQGTLVSLNLQYQSAPLGAASKATVDGISKAFDLLFVDWYQTTRSVPSSGGTGVQPN